MKIVIPKNLQKSKEYVDKELVDVESFINNDKLDILYNKISANGTYIVEDTHACYWPSHAGGLKHPQSFIEHAKNKIDEVNAGAAKLPTTEITKNTNSISFYDSVVVFEKRLQGIKQDARTRGYQWT